jgi:hypothetical protein
VTWHTFSVYAIIRQSDPKQAVSACVSNSSQLDVFVAFVCSQVTLEMLDELLGDNLQVPQFTAPINHALCPN